MFEVCHKQNSVCWHAICYKTKHKTLSTKQKNRRYVINAVSGAVSKACMCYAVHDTHIDSLGVTTYFFYILSPFINFITLSIISGWSKKETSRTNIGHYLCNTKLFAFNKRTDEQAC